MIYTAALLEDDPLFNAGTGSQIQSDGKIRMSAAIMNGLDQKFSGVINVENVKNPIIIAQMLMKEEDRVLGAAGASQYAENAGLPFYSTETPERKQEFITKKESSGTGTIGCVVLDGQGRLAAATSTGGKGFEIPGRISDSATIAGNYGPPSTSQLENVKLMEVKLSEAKARMDKIRSGSIKKYNTSLDKLELKHKKLKTFEEFIKKEK